MLICRRVRFVLLVVALFFAASFQAAGQSCPKPQVFYVNGVWNFDAYGTWSSAVKLNSALIDYGAPLGMKVIPLFNPGDGVMDDLVEVFISNDAIRKGADFVLTVEPQILLAWIQAQQIIDPLSAAGIRNRKVIDKIKSFIMGAINQKSPVVLIAHSQGNILVNEAVRQLQSDSATSAVPGVQDIGILGIGVAATSTMGSHYRYITADIDRVIGPLPGALPANYQVFAGIYDTFLGINHLVDFYLNVDVQGLYNFVSPTVYSRIKTAYLFNDVYNEVQATWPCVSVTSTPNPSHADEAVTFNVKVMQRPGDVRIPVGGVNILGASNIYFCNATLDAAGLGSCQYTFSGATRLEPITASYSGDTTFRATKSPEYPHQYNAGEYYCPPPPNNASASCTLTPSVDRTFVVTVNSTHYNALPGATMWMWMYVNGVLCNAGTDRILPVVDTATITDSCVVPVMAGSVVQVTAQASNHLADALSIDISATSTIGIP